jgi:hypothetical protein
MGRQWHPIRIAGCGLPVKIIENVSLPAGNTYFMIFTV